MSNKGFTDLTLDPDDFQLVEIQGKGMRVRYKNKYITPYHKQILFVGMISGRSNFILASCSNKIGIYYFDPIAKKTYKLGKYTIVVPKGAIIGKSPYILVKDGYYYKLLKFTTFMNAYKLIDITMEYQVLIADQLLDGKSDYYFGGFKYKKKDITWVQGFIYSILGAPRSAKLTFKEDELYEKVNALIEKYDQMQ